MTDEGIVPISVPMSYGAITESVLRTVMSDFAQNRVEETVRGAVRITYVESCNKDCKANQPL